MPPPQQQPVAPPMNTVAPPSPSAGGVGGGVSSPGISQRSLFPNKNAQHGREASSRHGSSEPRGIPQSQQSVKRAPVAFSTKPPEPPENMDHLEKPWFYGQMIREVIM